MAAGLVSLLLSFLVVEVGLRAFAAVKDEWLRFEGINAFTDLEAHLDSYEQMSPDKYYHWTLRPGYGATANEIIAQKTASGKKLGASAYSADTMNSVGPGIRVNSDGFRGDEIPPAVAGPSILMLGDSVTFGLTSTTYPRLVQDRLKEKGISARVINAGVEGYSIRNLEFELERYLEQEPQIVTIMIGWNDIYTSPPDFISPFGNLATVRATKRVLSYLETAFLSKDQMLEKMYGSSASADVNADIVHKLKDYLPPYIHRLRGLTERLSSSGAIVHLVTLPGIFTMSSMPSDKALRIGHLPSYTRNPFVVAAISDAFNNSIRELAADGRIKVIDLAAWSEEHLSPRDQYFSDAVHLTAAGLTKAANYISEQLLSNFSCANGTCKVVSE